MNSYYDRDRLDRGGLPTIGSAATRAADRNLTILDEEIERLRHNHSAPPFGSSGYGHVGARPYSPSPPTHSKKVVTDLHEQVKLYKSELDKKDRLIQDLSRPELRPTSPHLPRKRVAFEDTDYRSDPVPSAYMSQLRLSEYTRTEVATLQLKNEQLLSELKDTQNKVLARDVQIKELQNEFEKYQKDGASQLDVIHSLRVRVGELHEESTHINTAHNRGEHTISALQQEWKDQANRILELEARIRDLNQEREDSEQKAQAVQRNYNQVFVQLGGVVTLEEDSPEKLSEKIKELISENLTLRGKLSTIGDQMGNSEMEAKAGRETIQRLVAEINREQKSCVDTLNNVEKMRMERDSAVHIRNELERDNQLLKERIDASRRAWDSAKNDLEEHSSKMQSMSQEVKNRQFEAQVATSEFKSFKDALAVLLSDSESHCENREDFIRERVKNLQLAHRESSAHIDALEGKVKNLMSQLEDQSSLHQSALHRENESDQYLQEYKAKVKQLEGTVETADITRDRLRTDKQRYMEFLQKMASAMKVDSMSLDLGYDMNGDVLLARAEQLMRGEVDLVAEKGSQLYTLQRRVKTLKQQLESKDLHLDLMRKKVAQLEEGVSGKSNIMKEKDDYEWSYRKQQKESERLRTELSDAKRLIISMRAQLLDVSELKMTTLSASSTIAEMQKEIMKMEKIKEKQARKIAGMKQELEYTEQEATEGHSRIQYSVKAMADELQATKGLLNEIQRRERQLTDFRQVIARMLGMDVITLAVPDYEIISQLEKLIQAHHSHALTTFTVENSMNDMERNFRQGYKEASGRGRSRTRTRSVSPSRRKKTHQAEVY